ncbi:TAP-like protein-domain-containing protein [Mucidula mucida]|nr:TAP-like protein-domain-containing protein [Mucidula mucida]
MVFRSLLFSISLRSSSGAFAQTFDWSSVQATANFSWIDCYDGFQCTRLKVPLDYSNEDGDSVVLALVKYAATGSADDYRGMVLFNPGGPGGSGVTELPATYGPRIAQVLGSQYDIVSFDPRGVGVTTPRAEFFLTETERNLWLADRTKAAGIVNATHDTTLIPKLWAASQIQGQLAKDRDTTGLLPFIGLLRIIDVAGQEKLMYWGISYGTVLGATFAAMFPDRVDRLLIDGVVDVQNWYLGMPYVFLHRGGIDHTAQGAVGDADKALQTPHLQSLYSSVLASPIPVYDTSSGAYAIIDFTVLKNLIFTSLYAPYISFPFLAQGLAELQAGNVSTFSTLLAGGAAAYECNTGNNPLYFNAQESFTAINCGDAVEVGGSAADLTAYWDSFRDTSSFADSWMYQRVGCFGWKVYREGRFMGPISGNTSFPLLVIGSTADPVTPLSAAKKTAAGLPGAVILTQDSAGHSTFFAGSSNCTDGYIRSYFFNGTLPEEGTVCSFDGELFPA